MISFATDMVTAITIALIVVIVAVYLSILKRNGWIGEAPSYRCPNPKCQTIFQTPLKVKDLSNKKEVHLACPECGYDLGSSLNGEKDSKEITLQSKPKVKTQDLTSKPIETQVSPIRNGGKEAKASKVAAPIIESKKSESHTEIDYRLFLKQASDDSKKDRPVGCNHYLHYLGVLPKGTKTPDECYSCQSLIECHTKASD